MLESYFIEKNTKLSKAFNHQDNNQNNKSGKMMLNNTEIAEQARSSGTLKKNILRRSIRCCEYIKDDFHSSYIEHIKKSITAYMNHLAENIKDLPNDTSITIDSKDYFQQLFPTDKNSVPLNEVLFAIAEHQRTLKNNQNDSTQCTLNGLKLDFHFIPIRPYSIYHEYGFIDTQKIYHRGGHSEKETIYPFLTLLEMIRKGLLPENVSLELNCPYGLHEPYQFSKTTPIQVFALNPDYQKTTYFQSIAEAIGEGNLKEGTSITLSICDESMWSLDYMEKNITEEEVDVLIQALKNAPKKFKLILDYKQNLGKNDLLYSKMMKAIEDGRVPEDFSVHFIGKNNNNRPESQLARAIKNTQKNVHIGMLESYFIENNTKLAKAFHYQHNHQKSAYDHFNTTKASIYALPDQDYPIDTSHSQKLSTLKTQINNSTCAGKLFTIDDLDLKNLIDSMEKKNQSDFEKNSKIELLINTPIFELLQSLANDSFLANLFFGVHIGEKKGMPKENILRYEGPIEFNHNYFSNRRSAIFLLRRKLNTYIKEKNIEEITQTLKLIQSFQEIDSTMHLISKNIWKDADRDPENTSPLFYRIVDTVAQSYSTFVSNQQDPDVCNLVYKGLQEKLSKIIEEKEKCDNIKLSEPFKKMIDKISEWNQTRTISPPPPGIIKKSLITITRTTTDLSKKFVNLIASKQDSKDNKDNKEKTTQQFTNYKKNISSAYISNNLNNSKIVTDQNNFHKNKYYQNNINERAQKACLLTPEKQKNRGDSNRKDPNHSFFKKIGNTIKNSTHACVSTVRNWFSNLNTRNNLKQYQSEYNVLSLKLNTTKKRTEAMQQPAQQSGENKPTKEVQVTPKKVIKPTQPTQLKPKRSFGDFFSPSPPRHNPFSPDNIEDKKEKRIKKTQCLA